MFPRTVTSLACFVTLALWMSMPCSSNALGAGAEPPPAKKVGGNHYVVLEELGDSKVQAIKVVREWTGLGLAAAKELVEDAPCIIKKGLSKADAEKLKAELEANSPTEKKSKVWIGPSEPKQ